MTTMDDLAAAPPPPAFELSGDALCLDFANTWGDRSRPESDRLRSYEDLLRFAAETASTPVPDLAELARRAAREPAAAAAAIERAREVRDALYRLLAARARDHAPAPADLALLNATLRDALRHLELAPREEGYAWRSRGGADDLAAPLRPVARSAAELLVGEDLPRVRECDGATCTWLFLDRSRNRSRRWCSMESCGNRAKAARHYHRHRRGDGDSTGG